MNDINFYNRDDNSRATAGNKECKTKNKIKLQRRYLLAAIKKLHEKYLSEGGKTHLKNIDHLIYLHLKSQTMTHVLGIHMAFMVKKT